MESARLPDDEAQRLAALYSYDVLDSEAEKDFDDLTRLASDICQTPISLISLVDPDRQWFKSKVGLDADETSRDIAFCAHAILQNEVFEVQDTLQDPRFRDNPLVTDNPNIRFYAGTPLITPSGHAIGTLCAIDNKPRQLSAFQREALAILGRQVISQLELRRRHHQQKQALRHYQEYLSDISHELRTPLNAIIGLSQLLLEPKTADGLPSQVQKHLESIEYSGQRLLSLVDTVLELQRIDAKKMPVQWTSIELKSWTEKLHGMLMPSLARKQLVLNVHVDPAVPDTVTSDEAKLSQIALNLLNNAIKFSPQGGHIELQCYAGSDYWDMVVKDQGPGLSAEQQARLFNRFEQVSKQTHREGTGLGLVICRALAELLGGNIQVSSQPGAGCLFRVRLPYPDDVDVGAARSAQTDFKPAFQTELPLLVVEDNPINQEVINAILNSLGLECDMIIEAEQALDMLSNKRYALVMMDMHLPGMDGLSGTRAIHQHFPDIPVVLLTADVFLDPSQDGDVLFQGHLTKPVDKNTLVATLNQLIPATGD
ncbi:response regulator [Aestuariibacter halophilus]|uniref:histidine kinase n=1 Tax=Fluctibacter halophilus TaxID=226011 RepID=A0ABS8G7D0_9ALTE|nr:GAF domain-containing hybrid sensor histidine kinase/response regulator [Aestuariibacter halophilus]MCC2616492.1 response regulator [Aestuariibacter halophilus]